MLTALRQAVSLPRQRLLRLPITAVTFGRDSSNISGDITSSKHMQKLLTKKGAKTKRKWYQPHIAEPMELSGRRQKLGKKGVSESQGHRARQLSHVLYSKICQIINSGELSEELLTLQVLITRVKMAPTFSGINVYWDAGRSDAADIQMLLDGLAGKLRSLLISYHVLGRIPTITFVKDRSRGGGDLTQLSHLFDIADYGPDYVPRGPLNSLDAPNVTTEIPAHHLINSDMQVGEMLRQISFSTSSAVQIDQGQITVHTDQGKTNMSTLQTRHGHTTFSDSDQANLSSDSGWHDETKHQSESNDRNVQDKNDNRLSFRSDLYGLPHAELMGKVLSQKKKVKYQDSNVSDTNLKPSLSEIQAYSKMKMKSKSEERMHQLKNSSKVKQRLLERDFAQELSQDYLTRMQDKEDVDNDDDDDDDTGKYDYFQPDNDWNTK